MVGNGGHGKPDGQAIDQLAELLDGLKHSPASRRHIITAWNPADVGDMALPPCHCLFQFYVAEDRLSCQLYQRSADIFSGVPFNIASHALFTHMIAHVSGLKVVILCIRLAMPIYIIIILSRRNCNLPEHRLHCQSWYFPASRQTACLISAMSI